jgi:hypothetical protein
MVYRLELYIIDVGKNMFENPEVSYVCLQNARTIC